MLRNALLLFSGKGGVMTTTLTAQMAGLAAQSGWRVLAVDLNQQGNLARDLGYGSASDGGEGLYRAVMENKLPAVLENVRPNLDVIAAGAQWTPLLYEHLDAVNAGMDGADYGQLDTALAKVAGTYNLIIIDLPSCGDAIHRAALTAARAVLIPTQPDQASIDGLTLVAKGVANVRKGANPDLTILGVVLGPMPTSATRLRDDTLTRLQGLLGAKVHLFGTTIRYAQAVAVHCRELGLLAHEYEKQAREQPPWFQRMKLTKEERASLRSFSAAAPALAADYQALTTEVLGRFSELVAAS